MIDFKEGSYEERENELLKIGTKAADKAEEMQKFLQDRLSEDDFKKVTVLYKELMIFILKGIGTVS